MEDKEAPSQDTATPKHLSLSLGLQEPSPTAQGPPLETFCSKTVYPFGWGILTNTIQLIFKFKEEFCLPPSLWSALLPDLWPNPYSPGDWGPPNHKQLPFPLNPLAD